jgi:cyclophilin family peptidyl-prolyl cis-trans isomerase
MKLKQLIRYCLPILCLIPLVATATTVRLFTSLGNIDIELLDADAPATVANFLSYVKKGAYDGSFIHRSVPGFVIQGGGYTYAATTGVSSVAQGTPVANEFSLSRSNLRGTVAMAKLGGDPNSATNQWFVNLGNNSANLDNQNGGFTVFGRIGDAGMAIVDAIANLTRVNAGNPFDTLPVRSVPTSGSLGLENLVMVSRAAVIPTHAELDHLFNYLESQYVPYLAPTQPTSTSGFGYYYRYYTGTHAYAGVTDDTLTLHYLGSASGNTLLDLGAVQSWLNQATQAGY